MTVIEENNIEHVVPDIEKQYGTEFYKLNIKHNRKVVLHTVVKSNIGHDYKTSH